MQKLAEIKFICPLCQRSFEYDEVGEHQLVKCPACRGNLVTVNKGKGLELEYFEF
ncbi:MAG TPA: hypothetical protein VLH35_00145 [Candidatus Acidoferrales bacterium]|nr:hypothetical protein [Candidatus Acidoferrales bacterium]